MVAILNLKMTTVKQFINRPICFLDPKNVGAATKNIFLSRSVEDLTYLRLLGFERWQSANKGLPLGSVKDHLGSIGVVEASRMEVVLDGISPPSFGGGLWVFSSHGYVG